MNWSATNDSTPLNPTRRMAPRGCPRPLVFPAYAGMNRSRLAPAPATKPDIVRRAIRADRTRETEPRLDAGLTLAVGGAAVRPGALPEPRSIRRDDRQGGVAGVPRKHGVRSVARSFPQQHRLTRRLQFEVGELRGFVIHRVSLPNLHLGQQVGKRFPLLPSVRVEVPLIRGQDAPFIEVGGCQDQ